MFKPPRVSAGVADELPFCWLPDAVQVGPDTSGTVTSRTACVSRAGGSEGFDSHHAPPSVPGPILCRIRQRSPVSVGPGFGVTYADRALSAHLLPRHLIPDRNSPSTNAADRKSCTRPIAGLTSGGSTGQLTARAVVNPFDSGRHPYRRRPATTTARHLGLAATHWACGQRQYPTDRRTVRKRRARNTRRRATLRGDHSSRSHRQTRPFDAWWTGP